MTSYRFEPGPIHLVRLATGDDLVQAITAYCITANIRSASVSLLGAVTRASLRYYNQEDRRYQDFQINKHLEVVSGVGNISILDGEPFLHAHAAFSDEDGRPYGGHINAGTEVFALEATITELIGVAPVRQFDERTGLMLWGPNDA